MGDDIAERYARVLGHGGLGEAACYTVIQPVVRPFGVEEVARRLGADPAALRRGEPDIADFDRDECLYLIGPIGSAVVMVEYNGYQGSRPEVLRWLSDGARVHNAFWNVNGVNDLSCAVYGRVQASWSIDFPDECQGSDPTAFDGDLDELVAMAAPGDDGFGYAGYWQSGMMAFIERRTGVVLTEEWFDSPQYVLVAPPIPSDPSSPSRLVDADTDSVLRLAPDPVRRAALGWLLEELARTAELDGEPAVRDGIAALRAGRLLGGEAERAVYDVRDRMSAAADGVWAAADGAGTTGQRDARVVREQAGWAFTGLLCHAHGADPLDGLDHVRNAFGDRWDEIRKELRSRLKNS
ncbi:DUF6461 domain-containing protein [Couchioplanes caeruleus]|uniref:Uncharacterized protein n=2 Tax=Couchioplanes caeruleus TaxID=56438 RepID=A0A1K0GTK2_9ACTN|nr:DUF6461 domain-containing protein [Couchioplanes caeruleus]OJF15790.1 hypothetical protein BG844_02440 [Couchioplanes caeruleus subsp. caeruleus]ROP33045.1 hypothetical protein EDD30_6012 [Couchioplanes caeruleus]